MPPDHNSLAPSSSTSSFKRPRAGPPSPSSSPSPKRAASEDPASIGSSGHELPSPVSHLSENNQPASSSPLRMELDDDSQETTAWVERTGQVSLDEERQALEASSAEQTGAKEVYDALLGRSARVTKADVRLHVTNFPSWKHLLPPGERIPASFHAICHVR